MIVFCEEGCPFALCKTLNQYAPPSRSRNEAARSERTTAAISLSVRGKAFARTKHGMMTAHPISIFQ
jgi:hypothetical protein